MTTARDVLTILAGRSEQALQPPGRGAATAATLREIGDLAEGNSGEPCPAWDALGDAVQSHWCATAARCLTEEYQDTARG